MEAQQPQDRSIRSAPTGVERCDVAVDLGEEGPNAVDRSARAEAFVIVQAGCRAFGILAAQTTEDALGVGSGAVGVRREQMRRRAWIEREIGADLFKRGLLSCIDGFEASHMPGLDLWLGHRG